MDKEYKIIRGEGTGEIIEKKSRFIGVAVPVSSEEEAYSFIEGIRKTHYQARHNCFAFSLLNEENGSVLERFSDDGEPQGTAGLPILGVIRASEVNNILIVVTRYFGGTLLGTGGLVRAYTDASKAALGEADIHTVKHVVPVMIEIDYTDVGRIDHMIMNKGYEALPAEFTDKVNRTIYVPFEELDSFHKAVTEATSGKAAMLDMDDIYR
ncbi:uncharacterized protein, YigZ family [Eubacterium ruminantium]|nr:uncharacterized protein, YigZ family [Eubacterium ruminantium]